MDDGFNTDALRKSVEVHLQHELFGQGHFGWRPARADDDTLQHMSRAAPPFVLGEPTYRRRVNLPDAMVRGAYPMEAYVDCCFQFLRGKLGADVPLVVETTSSRVIAVETNEKGYSWLRDHLGIMSAGEQASNVTPLSAARAR